MAQRINREIAEARVCSDDPKKQTVKVVRWDAMQTLADDMQGFIEETIAERDRINEEKRLENAGSYR